MTDAAEQFQALCQSAPLPWSRKDTGDLVRIVDAQQIEVCTMAGGASSSTQYGADEIPEAVAMANMIVVAVNTCGGFKAGIEPEPGSEEHYREAMAQALREPDAPDPLTFGETLKGFATYCQSGAFSLDDGNMIAAKLENAAEIVTVMADALRAAYRQLRSPDSPTMVGEALRKVDSALRVVGEPT